MYRYAGRSSLRGLGLSCFQATEIDLLVGSLATGLCAAGGFCAGTRHVVDHQVHPGLYADLSYLTLALASQRYGFYLLGRYAGTTGC